MQAATDIDLATNDLGPLAWVLDELRKSLESASAALRRFVRDTAQARGTDMASVDAGHLRIARQQLHQAVGALEMVGLPAPATVLRSMEAAVQQFVERPQLCSEAAAAKVERAGFALSEYLEGVLLGRTVPPVALFPQYKETQELSGADRVHPADLWPVEWRWNEPQMAAAQPLAYDPAVRARLDQDVLKLLKSGDAGAARELSSLSLSLASAQTARQPRVFWQICAAYFEAVGAGLLPLDIYVKRAGSRILLQYASLAKGELGVSDRLAQDLVFFCSQAVPAEPAQAPALAAVRAAWSLDGAKPVDYHTAQYGRFDPALLAQARKRIAAVKETWSGLSGGDVHKLKAAAEQVNAVGDSLSKIHPQSKSLATALTTAVDGVLRSGRPPKPELAMEVATAILYLEAAFEDLDTSDEQLAKRTARLAERLDTVRQGGQPEALEPWMEELYRRVSDRQTMGSVVSELRGTLSELEKLLDQFFRNLHDKSPLRDAPTHLAQMRGVLSVLGLDQAAHAVQRMRESVEQIIVTEIDEEKAKSAGTFDKLGNNLGALGFLIDMLHYQPALAKKLFVYDDAKGELKPLMGRVGHSVHVDSAPAGDAMAAAAQPASAPAAPTVTTPAAPAVAPAAAPAAAPAIAPAATPAAAAAPAAPAAAVAATPADAGSDEDDELLNIFLEEAREVVQNGLAAIHALEAAPTDVAEITTLRRAFHTLKGSSRMVGLNEFGEAAWSLEQVLNTWLADQKPAHDALRTLARDAMQGFSRWIEDIASHNAVAWKSSQFRGPADAMRLENRLVPLTLPGAEPVADAAPADAPATEAAPPVVAAPQAVATPTAAEPTAAELPAAQPAPAAPSAIEPSFEAAEPAAPQAAAVEPLAFDIGDLDLPDLSLDAPATAQPKPEPASNASPALEVESDAFSAAEAAATPAASAGSPAEVDAQAFTFELPSAPEPVLEVASSTDEAEQPASVPEAVELEGIDFESLMAESEAATPVAPVATDESASSDAVSFELADLPSEPAAQSPAPQPEAAPADLGEFVMDFGPADATPSEPAPVTEAQAASDANLAAPEPLQQPDAASAEDTDDQIKVIGHLRIGIPLYNVYLNEADEWSRRLATEVAEWALDMSHPVPESAVGLAHALAGSSATVGFETLSNIARALEHGLGDAQRLLHPTPQHGQAYTQAAEEIRRLLHQFAAGFLKEPNPAVIEAMKALEQLDLPKRPIDSFDDFDDFVSAPAPLEEDAAAPEAPATVAAQAPEAEVPAAVAPVEPAVAASVEPVRAAPVTPAAPVVPLTAAPAVFLDDDHDQIDIADAVDPDLFPIFEEEAIELLPTLGGALRQWSAHPGDGEARRQVLRALHTLKGSARLAGALRLGEMAHRMESEIESLGSEEFTHAQLEPLLQRFDAIEGTFDTLRAHGGAPAAPLTEPEPAAEVPAVSPVPAQSAPAAARPQEPVPDAPTAQDQAAAVKVQPSVHVSAAIAATTAALPQQRPAANQAVRVRSQLLDRLVNQAGEVMITRSRLEAELRQLRGSLADLTGNLDRLRVQLRDIELQAETQMQSRLAQAKDSAAGFDPLEFDRFTRVQELTRMMAESVNDVATVQRNIQRIVESTEDDLIAQARQTRELQRDLLRTRMVEFDGISERLYRVVRLASKDAAKQVRLDITGGSIEMDRGVLDRMTPAFEHLLRNCVAHGIEVPEARVAGGKDATGVIGIHLSQEGNDVSVEFRDDGAGLDLARIRLKALQQGLVQPGEEITDEQAAQMIFMSGFSTASQVTEIAGRGVGMDVVRAEVNALGGRIETHTVPGRGTTFKLVLPLTTAVTQVVMVRAGGLSLGVPANLVEIVRRTPAAEVEQAYESGLYDFGGEKIPFFWCGALLQASKRSAEPVGRSLPVVIFRSAAQRVAVHVDEVLGNQEVVVKNLGPQLARLPGLAGMTVLASGAVVLIYNPVALASVYGDQARRAAIVRVQTDEATPVEPVAPAAPPVPQVPLVLVVDDSITVRRVTQRLLQREGYRVALAADGLQALERLAEERPTVVLSDIEMPRMDGFDLVRNIRADKGLRDLPVIMITSRIAEKHREHAKDLGVDHYLGKPYSEDELLGLIKQYSDAAVQA